MDSETGRPQVVHTENAATAAFQPHTEVWRILWRDKDMPGEEKRKPNQSGGTKWLLLALALGFVCWRISLAVIQSRLDRGLIEAVQRKDQAEVIALLRSGANPSARDLPHDSPFDYFKRLFHKLPRIHPEDSPTALLIAIRNDDLAIASTLVDANAAPNATDKEHITPLALVLSRDVAYDTRQAWEQNVGHLVDRLLDGGADPNARDTEGTPLLVLVVQKCGPDSSSGRLFQTIVRQLIQKRADLNARDEEGKTALLWSAWSALGQEKTDSFPEAMRLLIDCGADMRPSRNAGWSILNWAAYSGNITLALTLLAKGLTVNTPDAKGRTALHTAISQQKANFVRYLLEQGANVNAADNFGMTPLMFAVQNDDGEMCRLLLKRRANRKAREKDHGWTVEQLARYLHAERCLTLLTTGKIMPPVANRTPTHNRVPIDANRWLVVQHPANGDTQHDYLLTLIHRDGRQVQVDTLSSYSPLVIRVFRDGDGTPVAFVRWDDQGGGAALYRLEGMQAKTVWDEGSRYGSDFRPLKEGGCVVWTWRPAIQEISSEDPRANDEICLPYYYRNGKYTELEGIFFPGCLKQF